MKVLILQKGLCMRRMLIYGMTNNVGGVETFIHTIYLLFKEEYKIDFLVVDQMIPYEEEFVQGGSSVYKITPRYKNVIKFKKETESIFKNNSYDVLWFNKTTLSSIDCIKSARRNGVKKIICHSHASQNLGTSFTLMMHKFHQRQLPQYVDYKFACSVDAAKWFYGENIEDVTIIKNAVDVKKYLPNEKKIKEEKKNLQLGNEFVIGHIGRFSMEKNHKFLIDVFEKVTKKVSSHLILCGDGPLFEETKEYAREKAIQDKISFLGICSDIPDILQAIDVIVFPSLHEGLPFVLVEAQAAGIPCIVSSGVSEEVKLTDIVEFVSLEEDVEKWAELVLKYREYIKISKEKELSQRGYTLESVRTEIIKVLE